jgi:hypothetical protein
MSRAEVLKTLEVLIFLSRVAVLFLIAVLIRNVWQLKCLLEKQIDDLQDRSKTKDDRDAQKNLGHSQHLILNSEILGRLLIRFNRKHGKESGLSIHDRSVADAFRVKTACGGLQNVRKRFWHGLTQVFIGNGKDSLALRFLGFIRRHSPGLSVKHTAAKPQLALSDVIGKSEPKTDARSFAGEANAIGPNTSTLYMTYIV